MIIVMMIYSTYPLMTDSSNKMIIVDEKNRKKVRKKLTNYQN